jgi:hypothetical protein
LTVSAVKRISAANIAGKRDGAATHTHYFERNDPWLLNLGFNDLVQKANHFIKS